MLVDSTYKTWLKKLKQKIKLAQLKATVSINMQLMELYWELGKDIVLKQNEAKWGDAILDQLALDLKLSFPEIHGFSRRNLYAIRQYFLFYSPIK